MTNRALLIMAVVLAAGLAGCGTDPEPVPTQTVTPTPAAGSPVVAPEPSPTPTPVFSTPSSAPVMPAVARENTPEGAEAFARYWIETVNWGLATNDADPLAAASVSDCELCGRLIGEMDSRLEEGVQVEGGMLVVESIEPAESPADSLIVYRTVLSQEISTEIDLDGHRRDLWERTSQEVNYIVLSFTDEGWLVHGLGGSVECVDCPSP